MEGKPAYPIDIEAIERGRVFEEAEIVSLVGLKPGHPDFNHRVAHLQRWLRRQLAKAGRPLSVRHIKRTGCLAVLRNLEASTYTNTRCGQKLASFERFVNEMRAVDPSGFSSDDRHRHERSVAYRGAQLLHAKLAGRQAIARKNYERNTPGLIRLPATG